MISTAPTRRAAVTTAPRWRPALARDGRLHRETGTYGRFPGAEAYLTIVNVSLEVFQFRGHV